jgi:Putative DNA-binding domain
MNERAPTWLAEFQSQFAKALRAPLHETNGRLSIRSAESGFAGSNERSRQAEPGRSAESGFAGSNERSRQAEPARSAESGFAGSNERSRQAEPGRSEHDNPRVILDAGVGDHRSGAHALAVYNRQYWFRFFEVFQNEFRLTAALLGASQFNILVGQFLKSHPPRARSLSKVADGFSAVANEHMALKKKALKQALQIDESLRAISSFYSAPAATSADFQKLGPENVPRHQFRSSGRWQLLCEEWALLALQLQLTNRAPEKPVQLPLKHSAGPVWKAITLTKDGFQTLPLSPIRGLLYSSMRQHPLAEALRLVEISCQPSALDELNAQVGLWLQESIQLGFWTPP